MHRRQVHAHDDHAAAGSRPAQSVAKGLRPAHGVVHLVEAPQDDPVAEHAAEEMAAGETRHLLVGVLAQHDDVLSAQLAGHVGLPLELGQGGDLAVGLHGPDGLDGHQALGAAADDENAVAGLGGAAQGGPSTRAAGLDEDGLLVGDVIGDLQQAAGQGHALFAPAAADGAVVRRPGPSTASQRLVCPSAHWRQGGWRSLDQAVAAAAVLNHAVADLELRHLGPHLHHLADDFVAHVDAVSAPGEGCRGDAQVALSPNEVEVGAADAREVIADLHVARPGQSRRRDLHLPEGGQRAEEHVLGEARQGSGGQHTLRLDIDVQRFHETALPGNQRRQARLRRVAVGWPRKT